jgi:hypothetical protein
VGAQVILNPTAREVLVHFHPDHDGQRCTVSEVGELQPGRFLIRCSCGSALTILESSAFAMIPERLGAAPIPLKLADLHRRLRNFVPFGRAAA